MKYIFLEKNRTRSDNVTLIVILRIHGNINFSRFIMKSSTNGIQMFQWYQLEKIIDIRTKLVSERRK